MRRHIYLFAMAVALVLGLGGLQAMAQKANPFTGTWKLNPARSKYTAGAPAREETVTVSDAGGMETVEVNGTGPDGSPMTGRSTTPLKGGKGTITESPWDGISVRVATRNVRDVTYMKGGKAMMHLHVVVARDGKTLRSTVSGMNPQGQRVAGVSVFEKQ